MPIAPAMEIDGLTDRKVLFTFRNHGPRIIISAINGNTLASKRRKNISIREVAYFWPKLRYKLKYNQYILYAFLRTAA